MTEAEMEDRFVRYALAKGCPALKLRIDNQKGWPDRTVLTPCGLLFIEFKLPGGIVSEHQKTWLKRLRQVGQVAIVVTSLSQAIKALNCLIKE